MIQCKDCEFFRRSENGQVGFACDPFSNIKEPECLAKWQLLKINQLTACYQATLDHYRKLAPMQEKMFKFVEKEIEDIDEADKWKNPDDNFEDHEFGLNEDDWK